MVELLGGRMEQTAHDGLTPIRGIFEGSIILNGGYEARS